MSFDRKWLEEQGSEDSFGRALWALGICMGRSRRRSFQAWAAPLLNEALPAILELQSPRAWAFALLGIEEYLGRLSGDRLAEQIRGNLTSRLMKLFEAVASQDWAWFEDIVTYDNAKLAQALIVSGASTGEKSILDRGLKALRWLAQCQTSESGHFRPIGNKGFYRRDEPRPHFDQQPVEAYAMVSASLAAYRVTSDPFWYQEAQRAFDWFLGWNDLGLELYSTSSGGCSDGLLVDRINPNQGAESLLAFLLSLTELRLMQNAVTLFEQPVLA
jgi:hypothetical protein